MPNRLHFSVCVTHKMYLGTSGLLKLVKIEFVFFSPLFRKSF